MSDALLLGIDLGAGSLKSTVITARGEVVANASAPVETLTPRPGHSEQDPAGWWAALVTTLAALWADGVDPDRVVGPMASRTVPTMTMAVEAPLVAASA